jgi:hypothetical protein
VPTSQFQADHGFSFQYIESESFGRHLLAHLQGLCQIAAPEVYHSHFAMRDFTVLVITMESTFLVRCDSISNIGVIWSFSIVNVMNLFVEYNFLDLFSAERLMIDSTCSFQRFSSEVEISSSNTHRSNMLFLIPTATRKAMKCIRGTPPNLRVAFTGLNQCLSAPDFQTLQRLDDVLIFVSYIAFIFKFFFKGGIGYGITSGATGCLPTFSHSFAAFVVFEFNSFKKV